MSATKSRRRSPIDWDLARERLARARTATEEVLRPSPERARQIMDARARALARVPGEERPAGVRIDVVKFALASERYAVETRYVREVVRFVDFTPVPGTPDFVVGVTNLRGSVLAVIDLGRFFSVPRKGLTDLSRVVVLGEGRAEFGVLADEALGQAGLAAADILEPPGEVSGIGRAYLRGVTREAQIVLDGAALLRDQRLFVQDERDAGA